MISELDTEDILRLVAKYYPVYQILWDGPTSPSNIKMILMEDYELAESTARSYINAIYDEKAGPIYVDEDGLVKLDQDQVIDIEKTLEMVFRWDEFDPRHDLLKEEHARYINLDLKCGDLSHELDYTIADKKKMQRELNEKIADLESQLKEKDAKISEKDKELSECQEELSACRERLGNTLRMKAWKFVLYRIGFKVFNGEKRLQEEGL